MEEYIARLPVSTRVIRSEERTGLIRARLKGQGHVENVKVIYLGQDMKIRVTHQSSVDMLL